MFSAEQLEHAAHNLHMHETGCARDSWDQLVESERESWRQKALAKLGDYAAMSKSERQRENAAMLGISLSSASAPMPDAPGDETTEPFNRGDFARLLDENFMLRLQLAAAHRTPATDTPVETRDPRYRWAQCNMGHWHRVHTVSVPVQGKP